MDEKTKLDIVKTYINILKKDDVDINDKLQLLFELDSNGDMYNYLLYNVFINISEDNIRRHCVIFMDNKHLKAAMKAQPKWFKEDG